MNIWFRRLFVILPIGGGFAGFVVTIQELHASQPLFYYVIWIVACLAYLQGIVAGIKFLEKEEEGMRLLFWYYLAQVPIFVSPAISYLFASAVIACVTIGSHGVSWRVSIGSQWQLALLQEAPAFSVGVNFFALWAAWYLRQNMRKNGLGQMPGKSTSPALFTPPQL